MKTDNTFTRNVEVLETIAAAKGGLSFTEIIDTCKSSSRATLARQLKVMLEGEFIAQDEFGRYIIGPRALGFARSVLQIISRADLVQPLIERLADKLGESIAYMEVAGDGIMCIAKCEKPDSFHFLDLNSMNRDWLRSPFAHTATVHSDDKTAAAQRKLAAKLAEGGDLTKYERNLAKVGNEKTPCAPVFTCTGGRLIGVIGMVGFREGTPIPRRKEMVQQIHKVAEQTTAIFERNGVDRIVG